jgi:PD-(D/E)XK nuclease superfamily
VTQARFDLVKAEWLAITELPPPDLDRFAAMKREADAIIDAGRWVSGPSDLLSVLGRQRDELVHSRMIGWLLTPTGRHGLGRRFLRALLDHVWPSEQLLQSGVVTVDLEETRSAADEIGSLREARADIVVLGEDATIVIENKVDAGEGVEQCERLYWSWADRPTETRWLFLSPTGRPPVTAHSTAARAAWRALSYGDLHRLLQGAIDDAVEDANSIGRSTVRQYIAAIAGVVTN